jgi:hypothetical protein
MIHSVLYRCFSQLLVAACLYLHAVLSRLIFIRVIILSFHCLCFALFTYELEVLHNAVWTQIIIVSQLALLQPFLVIVDIFHSFDDNCGVLYNVFILYMK